MFILIAVFGTVYCKTGLRAGWRASSHAYTSSPQASQFSFSHIWRSLCGHLSSDFSDQQPKPSIVTGSNSGIFSKSSSTSSGGSGDRSSTDSDGSTEYCKHAGKDSCKATNDYVDGC